MAATLREYRAKIKSVNATKKITRAMELIAASRIIKAQQRAAAATPYARELTRAVSAVATFSDVDHPLTTESENPTRAAMLVITSDRGLAGAYSANVLREAERLREKLRIEGKEAVIYVAGRKGVAFYNFRQRPIEACWTGFSDRPTYADAREIGDDLVNAFLDEEEGVDEVHVVFSRFRSMLVQTPDVIRLMPLQVVEGEERPDEHETLPLFEFEPSASDVLDALLPAVRLQPDLLLPAAGSRLRAGLAPARHEVGDRQRPGPASTSTPASPTRYASPRSPRRSVRSSAAPTRWPTLPPGSE
jgi:F-type H+-transporting ATPase subunit gamma